MAPVGNMTNDRARRGLTDIWWALCPAFLVVVSFLTRERACFDRHYLLAGISGRPTLAWIAAGVYVAAHAWIMAVYALTVMDTGKLLPSIGEARRFWGASWSKVVVMVLLFLFEHSPAATWIPLSSVTGCGT
jgi:hypothetical protein